MTEPDEVSLEATARAAWRNVGTGGATLTATDETVVADEGRLQRLLKNLFRNSIEHGTTEVGNGEQPASGHRVEVGFEGDSPGAETVVVGDNGTGILDGDLDKIFESGYTTNRSRAPTAGLSARHTARRAAPGSRPGTSRGR